MLRIQNLCFSYNEKKVLKNINIIIKQGQIVALLGPNGSGKSTLLRCMNGFLDLDGGQVLFNGENIQNKKRKWISRHIALLPQNLEAVQQFTVYELISLGRSPNQQFGWGLKEKDKEIIEWAIQYMELDFLRNREMDKISGGERQRAWIAMILAQDTEVVLLDEPITFLDLKYQWYLLKIFKQIRQQFNKTFILVLHDINQAMTAADYFIVLKEGSIRAYGQAEDIITSHLLKDVYDVSAHVYNFNDIKQSIVLPAELS